MKKQKKAIDILIGANLRRLRQERGITGRELQRLLGIKGSGLISA